MRPTQKNCVHKSILCGAAAIALLACPALVSAQAVGDIRVDITNEGNSDFFLTPLWFGFHGGGFDMFDAGSAASSPLGNDSIERIAEGGDVSGLQADTPNPGFDGVAGGGPIAPGATATGYVTPANPSSYSYLSFASMVIPSNDSFIGNDNPMAYQVFDASDNIVGGTFTIEVYGRDIWDAGTEVNDEMGAAFSMLMGTSSDEDGVVALQGATELDDFLNTPTAAGTTIGNLIGQDELLATITVSIVPEPSSICLSLLGIAAFGLIASRRQKR